MYETRAMHSLSFFLPVKGASAHTHLSVSCRLYFLPFDCVTLLKSSWIKMVYFQGGVQCSQGHSLKFTDSKLSNKAIHCTTGKLSPDKISLVCYCHHPSPSGSLKIPEEKRNSIVTTTLPVLGRSHNAQMATTCNVGSPASVYCVDTPTSRFPGSSPNPLIHLWF